MFANIGAYPVANRARSLQNEDSMEARMKRSLSLAVCLFAAVGLPAQRARLVQPPTHTPATTEKPPYTATIVTTVDQTLADGNTIHREQTETQARDSQGRTRTEHQLVSATGAGGKDVVTVVDPIGETFTTWVVGSGIATVRPMHSPSAPATVGVRSLATSEASSSSSETPARAHDDIKTENLGTREIQGVEATGRRTIRTIPAGQEGNAEPIVSTRETWQSRTLNLTLLSIAESPKDGKRMSAVTELQQGEPDAALFQPPPDYNIKQDQ
jgi:hypothetical protein